MKNFKVVPMLNEIGNVVKNQYTFYVNDDHYFQSYDQYVAKVTEDGQIFLDSKFHDASKTTEKYRNRFLNMSNVEVINGMNNGDIQLVNLNEGS